MVCSSWVASVCIVKVMVIDYVNGKKGRLCREDESLTSTHYEFIQKQHLTCRSKAFNQSLGSDNSGHKEPWKITVD